MVSKLFPSFILLILVPRPASTASILFTPEWYYNDGANIDIYGINYIPVDSPANHVTGVELGLTTSGAIYTLNILGDDGVTRIP